MISNLEAVARKILSVHELPTSEEAEHFIRKGDGILSNKRWSEFREKHKIFFIPTIEFMDGLAALLRELNQAPIVEVCAGNGKLTYQLKKRGIDVAATDDYSWKKRNVRYSKFVERLNHKEALEKYKPQIVIAAWIPHDDKLALDILDFPSVQHYIDIGDGKYGATGCPEVFERGDFSYDSLYGLENNAFCRADFPDFTKKSVITLFTRKK